MRGLMVVIFVVITGVFCALSSSLPKMGDAGSPPNSHVTPDYIARSVEDTGSPNVVTGIIIDYRGFDTMYETTVMFLAGLTAFVLLKDGRAGRPNEEEDPSRGRKGESSR
ncbi:MAG TPA: hypothetical protein H9954_02600 [Candidatus Phascolarctobacterium stercoravium]|nr:hypothetical protein [Candidatus Phascolarctobacterium stercoravium]